MGILAFETSAKAASVALLEGGNLLAESYQNAGLTTAGPSWSWRSISSNPAN